MFVVGGLGFEFCVFVAGWRHALRSEWPFIIIIKVLKATHSEKDASKAPTNHMVIGALLRG